MGNAGMADDFGYRRLGNAMLGKQGNGGIDDFALKRQPALLGSTELIKWFFHGCRTGLWVAVYCTGYWCIFRVEPWRQELQWLWSRQLPGRAVGTEWLILIKVIILRHAS